MKHRHFTQAARRLTALTLALLLALPSAYAAAGSPQLRTTRELADGLTYSNTITSHSAAGRVESFSLELSPDSREVEPIFLQASGTAYGAGSINLAVSYAQSLGYHVLGAINTDFFAPSTGVPLGISIEDGIYKSSPEAEAAVVITDGEVELVEQSQALQLSSLLRILHERKEALKQTVNRSIFPSRKIFVQDQILSVQPL